MAGRTPMPPKATNEGMRKERECEHMVQAIEFELIKLKKKANETIGTSMALSRAKRTVIARRIRDAVVSFAYQIVFPERKKK